MHILKAWFLLLPVAFQVLGVSQAASTAKKTCRVSPLGHGRDDTDQVLDAIAKCGKSGRIIFEAGSFNITRKMTWNLKDSQVDLFGMLSFVPDIEYWLNANNTYRVVGIQSQASWFVVTGRDFVLDAHNVGGINGNGQPWWEYFQSHVREDGDGRPLSLTLFETQHAVVRNFHIHSPPFWCNTVANSVDVVYDHMNCNATNTNPAFFGKNIVPNTDGIDTYRSDRVQMLNWDVTCGDDCLALKGNSSNILARNITCRGGNGVAIGSIGQYVQFNDIVENVLMEDMLMTRINSTIEPNMVNGVYFKSWDGSITGSPPNGGGGGGGFVQNVTLRRITLDRVDRPTHFYQTNGGVSGDAPSTLQFRDIAFVDWVGTATANKLVDIECSPAAPCPNISFTNFDISPPNGTAPSFVCINAVNVTGLPGPCNATGHT